ncbi:MAG: bifunctional nuclease family protein [Deltaproteobacteria bacterium]|nr:bifunctional nuclease family protein [Deltaproteobacteria bacterium]
MIEMEVVRVAAGANNQAVVILRSQAERKLLPIWIGEAEANAIQLRLAGRKPPRPLTHDLLDRVIAQLGARLVKVHVEDLRDNIFYGRVFLKQGNKDIDIDARPSDSIALAVGARVPVIVARRVLDAAGVDDKPPPPPGGDKDTL